MPSFRVLFASCFSLCIGLACAENPVDVPVTMGGAVRITAATRGRDLDEDGYVVLVDGRLDRAVPPNGTVVVTGLTPGDHRIEIFGVGGNCAAPLNARTVAVVPGKTVPVVFDVGCLATGVAVEIATTGVDRDDAYELIIDGMANPGIVPGNTTFERTHLLPGNHVIQLSAIAPNCSVTGDVVRTVTLAVGDILPVGFAVSCVAVSGVMQFEITTRGADFGPSGYDLVIDEVRRLHIPNDHIGVMSGLRAGEHSLELQHVGWNCSVTGGNERLVRISTGGPVRDTASVAFEVGCVRAWEIAFVRSGALTVGTADGAHMVEVGEGQSPSWSPDGARIAFDCGGICLLSSKGGALQHFPVPGLTARDPAWHPQGQRLAYVLVDCNDYYPCEFHGLFTVNADGTGSPARIPLPGQVAWAAKPVWSPDGRGLAFPCTVTKPTVTGLCSIGSDGTGFQLLSNAATLRPAWSPDGKRIAFATTQFGDTEIAVVNADGSGLVRLMPNIRGFDPAWSPDGTRILFTRMICPTSECEVLGLFVTNADGTGLQQVTFGPDQESAWRP